MDRAAFYKHLRKRDSGVFGTSLSQRQVDGIEPLLDAGHDLSLHHMANVLGQVYHETGGKMYPVRETFAASDQQAINRLEHAWEKGDLPWVTEPYWRDGYFGRGQIQLTFKRNYDKFGITDPDDALKPSISADVAVRGMRNGMFTGKRLADFQFPDDLDAPPASNPRRIVNGQDGKDDEVAGYHRAFASALAEGGWNAPDTSARPEARPQPEPSGFWTKLFRAILGGSR